MLEIRKIIADGALKNEGDYDRTLALLEDIFDAEEGSPEFDLIVPLCDLVSDYEDIHYPFPPKIVSEPTTEVESEAKPVAAGG